MPWNDSARWFDARRAQNRKPSTYRCPLCGKQLPALMEHMLLFPEGDHSRRRHAHSACVMQARAAGRLPTKSEWERSQRSARGGGNAGGGLLGRLRRAVRGWRGGSPPA